MDDILYGEIKKEGATRTETQDITEHLSVEYEVTTTNGQDHYVIKSITVTSHSSLTVKVDDKIVLQPPPPFYDDGCYLRRQDLIDAFNVLKTRQASNPPTRTRRRHGEWRAVRNDCSPSNFGSVGLPELRDDIPEDRVRDTCLDALRNVGIKK